MLLVYENRTDGIVVEWKKTVHFPPHLHEAIEVVYVTDGDIELGVGQELYHMDEGDFAIVFPNVIHHYQVFGKKENKVIFLYSFTKRMDMIKHIPINNPIGILTSD
mgnify:CR=1 FL=1